MIGITRQISNGTGRHTRADHAYQCGSAGERPIQGGTVRIAWQLPMLQRNGQPFVGMDPSDPSTYVRPWNPRPGMIGRLNSDGAQEQAYSDTGTRSNPASWAAIAGGRPRRRPR